MNQKNIFLTAIILISFFGVVALTNAATTLPDPGATPDSSLYFLKTWKESIQTFFTFGLENKAKQYLHLADVRLAEYQKMIDNGKTDIAQKTLDKYENQLNRALQKAEEMKQKGKDVKDISQKLEDKIAKHAEVLEKNLEKVPEAGKKGLEKALEESNKVLEKVKGPKSQTNLIEVFTPKPNEVVKSPIKIEGKARGTWFFEGSFPVKLLDKNRNVLGTAVAQAQGDWMTEDFVNFKVTLEFGKTEAEKGILVFEKQRAKDNEIAAELKVPVVFKQGVKPKPIDWESLIPSIRIVLKQAFPDIAIENPYPISIGDKVDITGDGVPEAFVDPGTGGAATLYVALVKIENDKPIVPLFKQKDGKVSTLMFTAGAGGSGRYGSSVKMVANKNAVYYASYSKYGESTDYCSVEAYQWNAQTKIFEFNLSLSNEIQPDYCSNRSLNL